MSYEMIFIAFIVDGEIGIVYSFDVIYAIFWLTKKLK
jgi:hypothetical protein